MNYWTYKTARKGCRSGRRSTVPEIHHATCAINRLAHKELTKPTGFRTGDAVAVATDG